MELLAISYFNSEKPEYPSFLQSLIIVFADIYKSLVISVILILENELEFSNIYSIIFFSVLFIVILLLEIRSWNNKNVHLT